MGRHPQWHHAVAEPGVRHLSGTTADSFRLRNDWHAAGVFFSGRHTSGERIHHRTYQQERIPARGLQCRVLVLHADGRHLIYNIISVRSPHCPFLSSARTDVTGALYVPVVCHLEHGNCPQCPAHQANEDQAECYHRHHQSVHIGHRGHNDGLQRNGLLGHRHPDAHLRVLYRGGQMAFLWMAPNVLLQLQASEGDDWVQHEDSCLEPHHANQQQHTDGHPRTLLRFPSGGILQPGQQMERHGQLHGAGNDEQRLATRDTAGGGRE